MNEVEAYIKGFPIDVQEKLNAIRDTIHDLVPEATERICMRMPTYDLSGKWFIHFAGYSKHIGFYPHAEPILVFKDKLTDYKISKGTIQFPINKPLPLDLIKEIIQFKLNELKN